MQHLKGTREKEIVYEKSPSCQLVVFADYMIAEKRQNRRSVVGGAVFYACGVV